MLLTPSLPIADCGEDWSKESVTLVGDITARPQITENE